MDVQAKSGAHYPLPPHISVGHIHASNYFNRLRHVAGPYGSLIGLSGAENSTNDIPLSTTAPILLPATDSASPETAGLGHHGEYECFEAIRGASSWHTAKLLMNP